MVLDAVLLFLVLLLCGLLVGDGQDVALDVDLDVLLLDARQVGLHLEGCLRLRRQAELVRIPGHIHIRLNIHMHTNNLDSGALQCHRDPTGIGTCRPKVLAHTRGNGQSSGFIIL